MSDIWEARLADVRARIVAAGQRAGRAPETVQLLPVSKGQRPEHVSAWADYGLTVFAESRVQEARQKIPLCPSHLSWHLVGHLQTNKVKEAVRLFSMIHSVDSLKLLEAIDAAGEVTGRIMPVLLEVNVAGESSKYGLAPAEVPAVLQAANTLPRVDVVGLMTIPPFTENPEQARPFFQQLRLWRDQWRQQTSFALNELSMGMSRDFEIAIEEGATWIRLGTVLFGQREG